MMASGNPNWWSMNGMHPQPQQLSSTNFFSPASSHSHQYLFGSSTISDSDHPNQDFPRSWSQLLMCGLPIDHHQERSDNSVHCQYNWFQNEEEPHHHHQHHHGLRIPLMADVKQEIVSQSSCGGGGDGGGGSPLYGHLNEDQQQPQASSGPNFRLPHHHQLVSSPSSCVTSLSNNHLLNFSTSSTAEVRSSQHSDHSTEGNSSSTGGLAKKPRVQQSSTQPALKVRKEKLGDRISALHQLVSPFGKTDTASVLSESIGYIRFLLGQIEMQALSSPHLSGNVSKSMGHQHSVQERNCLFTQDSTQFPDEGSCLKRREPPKQDGQSSPRDLRSRGLCLVPISYTQHMGSDHGGADYWSPALGGGF